MRSGILIKILAVIVRAALFVWHPVFRVVGRENYKPEGNLMICANHSGMADPIWIFFALKMPHVPRIMAKKEVMAVPVLGWFLRMLGVIGVDRDQADLQAIKTGLRCLHDGQQMMIFPEGTRVRKGQKVTAKRGAVTLAVRTGTPILPVYLTPQRKPFSPLKCVIGEPYFPDVEGKRATDEQLYRFSDELLEKIYALGEEA